MDLTEEDKATLVAAAKILLREPDNALFDTYEYATNEEVAEALCRMTELPEFRKLIPVKFILKAPDSLER